jgi:hypothetical protein
LIPLRGVRAERYVEVSSKRGEKYIKEGMTERRNKTKGGREEYRKKQHDNEKGSKGRWPAERRRGKTAKIFRYDKPST